LCRELFEELRIEPCERCLQPFSFASWDYGDMHLVMPLYLCRQWDGIAVPQEGQRIKWVFPKKIPDMDLDFPSQTSLTPLNTIHTQG